jgi:hypothetical protein
MQSVATAQTAVLLVRERVTHRLRGEIADHDEEGGAGRDVSARKAEGMPACFRPATTNAAIFRSSSTTRTLMAGLPRVPGAQS